MFDCSIPSALAKQGVAFTSGGRLNLYRGVYKLSDEPVDPRCDCTTCARYSRAYVHHLTKAGEVLGWQLTAQLVLLPLPDDDHAPPHRRGHVRGGATRPLDAG